MIKDKLNRVFHLLLDEREEAATIAAASIVEYVEGLEARLKEKDDCLKVSGNYLSELLSENDSLLENSDSLEAANEVKNEENKRLLARIAELEADAENSGWGSGVKDRFTAHPKGSLTYVGGKKAPD